MLAAIDFIAFFKTKFLVENDLKLIVCLETMFLRTLK